MRKNIMLSIKENRGTLIALIFFSSLGAAVGLFSLEIVMAILDGFSIREMIEELESVAPWFPVVLYLTAILSGIICVMNNGPLIGIIKTIFVAAAIGIIIWVVFFVMGIVMIFVEEPAILLPVAFIIGLITPTTITIWIS